MSVRETFSGLREYYAAHSKGYSALDTTTSKVSTVLRTVSMIGAPEIPDLK